MDMKYIVMKSSPNYHFCDIFVGCFRTYEEASKKLNDVKNKFYKTNSGSTICVEIREKK